MPAQSSPGPERFIRSIFDVRLMPRKKDVLARWKKSQRDFAKNREDAIEATIKHFETLDRFLNFMVSDSSQDLSEWEKDLVSGVRDRFSEIDTDTESGHGWIHERA